VAGRQGPVGARYGVAYQAVDRLRSTRRFVRAMEQTPTSRACPACGSRGYTFRSRRQVEAVPDKGEPAQLETKYRSKGCNEEWKEKVPGVLQKAPPPPK
jgi:hypothetical protein